MRHFSKEEQSVEDIEKPEHIHCGPFAVLSDAELSLRMLVPPEMPICQCCLLHSRGMAQVQVLYCCDSEVQWII